MVKKRGMQKPKLLMTRIPKGYSDEELKAMILEKNEDLRNL